MNVYLKVYNPAGAANDDINSIKQNIHQSLIYHMCPIFSMLIVIGLSVLTGAALLNSVMD